MILFHKNPWDKLTKQELLQLNSEEFFLLLKNKSEQLWQSSEINPKIYGYQIQKDTKWNPGLNENEIENFENELNFTFPNIYKSFLKIMNGTDKPGINVYGESGIKYSYSPIYYSYPRDLKLIKEIIEHICKSNNLEACDMDGGNIPFIIPITGHRFLISDSEQKNPVLSMYGKDIIPYALSLKSFLINDLFNDHIQEKNLNSMEVNFWLIL